MRILLVAPHFYPHMGGIERHVACLGEALSMANHEVTVATIDHEGKLQREETVNGMRVLRFRTAGKGAYNVPFSMLAYLAREGRAYDAIHAFNYGALPLFFASLIGGKRCVVTPCYHRQGHTSSASKLRKLYDPFAKIALRRAARIVCLSKGEAQEVSDCLGISPDRMEIIPSGSSVGVSRTHTTSAASDGDGERIILSVGRLEQYKRVDRAIEAMPYLAPNRTLVVVGDGPDRERLAALAASLGVKERVRFAGQVSDEELKSLYGRASTVVSFSETESFGITVLEALHYGKRVMCSDIPAFRDFREQFPQAVSLVGANKNAKGVAHLLQGISERPLFAPLDLHGFSWASIAGKLAHIYGQLVTVEGRRATAEGLQETAQA